MRRCALLNGLAQLHGRCYNFTIKIRTYSTTFFVVSAPTDTAREARERVREPRHARMDRWEMKIYLYEFCNEYFCAGSMPFGCATQRCAASSIVCLWIACSGACFRWCGESTHCVTMLKSSSSHRWHRRCRHRRPRFPVLFCHPCSTIPIMTSKYLGPLELQLHPSQREARSHSADRFCLSSPKRYIFFIKTEPNETDLCVCVPGTVWMAFYVGLGWPMWFAEHVRQFFEFFDFFWKIDQHSSHLFDISDVIFSQKWYF